jgi:hypothetical protein
VSSLLTQQRIVGGKLRQHKMLTPANIAHTSHASQYQ